MPELPEVEVLRRSLVRSLPGRRVVVTRVARPDLREPIDPEALRQLEGSRIRGLRRRAKYLLVDFEGGVTVVVHLGMSGQLTLVGSDQPRALHEHVAWSLDDGRRLRFVDPRRFGLMVVVATADLATDRRLRDLGREPLDPGFDGRALAAMARGRRAPVKSFLMDGRRIVGVGNIYASEALFQAGIHPSRSVARIGLARWDRLASTVRSLLAEAISAGGTSVSDYVDGEGREGTFQGGLAVYGREGEACRRCERPIRRLVQSGRSTYYCPGCQR